MDRGSSLVAVARGDVFRALKGENDGPRQLWEFLDDLVVAQVRLGADANDAVANVDALCLRGASGRLCGTRSFKATRI